MSRCVPSGTVFFAENDAAGNRIDYQAAVSGELRLAPDGAARAALADDYNRMLADGMLLDDEAPFDEIMTGRADLLEIEGDGPTVTCSAGSSDALRIQPASHAHLARLRTVRLG